MRMLNRTKPVRPKRAAIGFPHLACFGPGFRITTAVTVAEYAWIRDAIESVSIFALDVCMYIGALPAWVVFGTVMT